MKRKIWVAVISLILILTFLICYFNYDGGTGKILEGTLVWNADTVN